MRLKRLELQGFKSFLDRTVLSFEPGVTGVVGPNGCGKSNIVDAILWVMGEQSPKHLRGENMTDVIFAGSDSRPPTSMAEVSLVLDKQGVALAPQFAAFDSGDEISITRRIYRDGTGEFLINKSACRLKDIHELFMDTGVGRRAYSIIEQGQIDRMINVKPEERRAIFEEVAGITKYKAKRKEAEKKLEQTRGNLVRLEDIVIELEKQLRSLKIQATRAKKFRELKAELEAVDLFLMGRELAEVRREVQLLEEERQRLCDERSRWDADIAGREAELVQLEVTRVEQEKAYQEASARERDLLVEREKVESALGLFDERQRNLERTVAQAADEEHELSEREYSLRRKIDDVAAARDAAARRLEEIETTLAERERELQQLQEARREATRAAEKAVAEVSRAQAEVAQASSRLEAVEQRAGELEDKARKLALAQDEAERLLAELTERLAHADARAEEVRLAIAESQSAVEAAGTRTEELSRGLEALEEKTFRLRETFHEKRSKQSSLEELAANFEGLAASAKEIFPKLKAEGIDAKPLAELLRPSPELEDPLELLLGDELGTVVVRSVADARRAAEIARDAGIERVRIVSVEGAASAPAGAFSGRKLLDQVAIEAGYETVARWALGSVELCSSDEALFAGSATHDRFSLEGHVYAGHDGVFESGRLPSRAGVFARRREIEVLAAEAEELEKQLAAAAAERQALLDALKAQEQERDALKATLSELHVRSMEARKEREKVQFEREHAERDRMSLEAEATEIDERRLSLDEERARHRAAEMAARERATVASQLVAEAQSRAQTFEQSIESALAATSELRSEKSAQTERQVSLEQMLARIEAELDQVIRRCNQLVTQREAAEAELGGLGEQRQQAEGRKVRLSEELDALRIRLADTQRGFYETCERIQTMRDELSEQQKSRDAVLDRLREVEIKLGQETSRRDALLQRADERYQLVLAPVDAAEEFAPEKAPLFFEAVPIDWTQASAEEKRILLSEHAKALREKVSRYGEVNLTAIQEFDEVQKRYDFLVAQRHDLLSSIRILEEAIQRIDETTKTRFKDTFDAIQRKFGEIFPVLFNGGKGELVLTNSENPLEAGVDILVQPPGKRLQSITLLSGGEKALTAVSLVLAIFARKPSPFCLLDEVDAPLDDANVSRFNTVIRKMAEKTQFIVITHNKKTMEIAEALYGVTMERAGVSKMASVRLTGVVGHG